jgi:hypothetical protein
MTFFAAASKRTGEQRSAYTEWLWIYEMEMISDGGAEQGAITAGACPVLR